MLYEYSGALGLYLRKGGIYMTQNKKLSEKVGYNLKRLIKESDFKTQEQFAVLGICVDPVTVRRWIAHGVKDINTIAEIADILNVSLEELLKWSSFLVQFLYYFYPCLKSYNIYMNCTKRVKNEGK